MDTSEPLIFGTVIIEKPSPPADFQKMLRWVRLLSDGGKRSITIPNGDVPTLIAALELAADRAI